MSDGVRVSQSVRASVSNDGLVILDVRGGLLLSANVVGARIWQLVEQQVDASDIARAIASEYDVPIDRARVDVDRFVRALVNNGLVVESARC